MSKLEKTYRWRYWFAWYPIKTIDNKRVWWKYVITDGKVYIPFTGDINKGISIMVPLDHIDPDTSPISNIERKK